MIFYPLMMAIAIVLIVSVLVFFGAYYWFLSVQKAKGKLSNSGCLAAGLVPVALCFCYYASCSASLKEPLVEASCRGDVDEVRKRLLAGEDPNTRDQTAHSALQCAVENDHVEVAALLLESGANMEDADAGDPDDYAAHQRYSSSLETAEASSNPAMKRLFAKYKIP